MSQRSRLRLIVLQVLVLSLMLTLFGRLYYLQVIAGDQYQQAAADNRIREVVTPATRGLILDDVGEPLAQNRTTLVVSVDRTALAAQKDGGTAVLNRLASTLGTTYPKLHDAIQLCGTPGAKKPPTCWNGSPYQPIPVAKDVKSTLALSIMERSELYPGVTAGLEAVRDYPEPDGANAAQLIGYLGPVTADELKAEKSTGDSAVQDTDLVGRAGLEAEYDRYLRGQSGVQSLAVDQSGAVEGTVDTTPAKPGDYVVTNINAKLQAVVEKALSDAVTRTRNTPVTGAGGGYYKADSAAAVVMDTQTGQILSMASYPSYNPNVWVGGISQKELNKLQSKKDGSPLISRAWSALFAPGSTFKVVSATAAVDSGSGFFGSYACPSQITVGNRTFHNFESEALGNITLATAIEKSCDTVFYKIAYDQWLKDGGITPIAHPNDVFINTAKKFGFGKLTGVDLPSEAQGLIADRAYLKRTWEQEKDELCAIGRGKVAGQTPYQRAIAAESCVDGYELRAGDAVNFAIGQGDTLTTPLQLTDTYAAIANGGSLLQPQVAKAIVSPSGSVVKTMHRKVNGKLGISPTMNSDLTNALESVVSATGGTGYAAFHGFPLSQIPIAGKTGTAEGINTQPTAWFASFAPANKPRYAVVVMVSQGGTGATAAAPAVRTIYNALFGVKNGKVDPAASVLPNDAVPTKLPTIRKDGTVVTPTSAATSSGSGSTTPPPARPTSSSTVTTRKRRRRGRAAV